MPTAPKTFRLHATKPINNGKSKAAAERCNEYFTREWRDRTRLRIIARDGCQCRACGAIVTESKQCHIDHVTPKSQGGTSDDENLQLLCHSCHSRKTLKENGLGGG